MPARVEYRLGSIFDVACDILVIPSSAGGTVTPRVHSELRRLGLPSPPAQPWGNIVLMVSQNPAYGEVAYAAAVAGQQSTPEMIERIGASLGSASRRKPTLISAPLLGSGAGNLLPLQSVQALEQGFLATAPASAVLVISVLDRAVLDALRRKHPRPVRQGFDQVPQPAEHGEPADRAAEPAKPRLPKPYGLGLAVPQADPPPAAPANKPKRNRVFISYSHADAEWLERLQKHLRPLERDGAAIWADTRIKAGAQWREEIRAALAETKVAILLISADFMASEFIVTDELPPLLKAAKEEGATILPVIISASAFTRTPSLSQFQAVNNPDKPLVQLRRGNREKVLDEVARAVEDALKQ